MKSSLIVESYRIQEVSEVIVIDVEVVVVLCNYLGDPLIML